mgnify:CR=1 FL=1
MNYTGLTACTNYEFKVSASCAAANSVFSADQTFTTDGCTTTCDQPTGVTVTNITTTTATVNWNGNAAITQTQIQYRPGPGTSPNTVVAGGSVTSKNLNNLTPSTNYQMRVRHNCAGIGLSPFKFKPFVTIGARFGEAPEMKLYPNPVSNELFVTLKNVADQDVTIQVTDITGKIILEQIASDGEGQTVAIKNVEALGNGIYFLRVIAGERSTVEKFVKMN